MLRKKRHLIHILQDINLSNLGINTGMRTYFLVQSFDI